MLKQSKHQLHCSNCIQANRCIGSDIFSYDIERVKSIPLEKKETLFEQNEKFYNFYIVRTGSIKLSLDQENENENENEKQKIVGFSLPGEIIGFSGLVHNSYPMTAVALEPSTVCEIPIAKFEGRLAISSSLRQKFFITIGSQIIDSHSAMISLNKNSDQRVSDFFFNIKLRLKTIGFSFKGTKPRVSQSEIGNYLGLAPETVSRSISKISKLDFLTNS